MTRPTNQIDWVTIGRTLMKMAKYRTWDTPKEAMGQIVEVSEMAIHLDDKRYELRRSFDQSDRSCSVEARLTDANWHPLSDWELIG